MKLHYHILDSTKKIRIDLSKVGPAHENNWAVWYESKLAKCYGKQRRECPMKQVDKLQRQWEFEHPDKLLPLMKDHNGDKAAKEWLEKESIKEEDASVGIPKWRPKEPKTTPPTIPPEDESFDPNSSFAKDRRRLSGSFQG